MASVSLTSHGKNSKRIICQLTLNLLFSRLFKSGKYGCFNLSLVSVYIPTSRSAWCCEKHHADWDVLMCCCQQVTRSKSEDLQSPWHPVWPSIWQTHCRSINCFRSFRESKGYTFGIFFFELFVRQHFENIKHHWINQCKWSLFAALIKLTGTSIISRPPDPGSLRRLGLSGLIPAVDDHGPSIRIFSLFTVGCKEELEDTAWLVRDAMIGPAHVLVVPDGARMFCLQEVERENKYVDTKIKSTGRSFMFAQCKKQTNKTHTQESESYLVHRRNLQHSDFVLIIFYFGLTCHHVLTNLLGAMKFWPVWHTFILHENTE